MAAPTPVWLDRIMSPHWTRQIARSLASGRPTPALETHLDPLLVWLGNPDNPRVSELEGAVRKARLNRAQARASAYRLLDALFFEGEDQPASFERLGLDSDLARAKQRYRRLMQVYHPDRHPDRLDWATRRSELINRAFTAARQDGREGTRAGGRSGRNRPGAAKGADDPRPVWHPGRIRRSLEDRAAWTWHAFMALGQTQRRLVAGGALALLALLVLVALPDEAPKPAPRIPHYPVVLAPLPTPKIDGAKTEAPPTPPASPPSPILAQEGRGSTPESAPVQARTATLTKPPDDGPRPPDGSDRTDQTPPAPAPAGQDEPTPAPAPVLSDPPTDTTPDVASAVQIEPAPPERPPAPTADPSGSPWTGVGIPPPTPPAPPTPPEAPTTVGAASLKPLGGAGSVAPFACQGVTEALQRFQQAYQAGALDRFMALYSPRARENELATWFAIRQTYADWFAKTSARRITFDQLQVQPISETARCAAIAIFRVSYLDEQARLVTKAGVIEVLFEQPDSDEPRILRIRY